MEIVREKRKYKHSQIFVLSTKKHKMNYNFELVATRFVDHHVSFENLI